MAITSADKLVVVKAFAPANPLPLDAREIYDSLAEAQVYAKSSAVAYAGQTVKVVEDGVVTAYVLAPSDVEGENFTLQVYSNGQWKTIVEGLGTDELSEYLVSKGDGNADLMLVFDLDGIEASKIRVYSESKSNSWVTLYEIECSGFFVRPVNDSENILIGKNFVAATGGTITISGGYGYEKLTDGIIDPAVETNGRFSTGQNGDLDGTVDLGGVYRLSEIRFYVFRRDCIVIRKDRGAETYRHQW